MKVAEQEISTLDAINAISDTYPFAASLLVYVLIERALKEYIIEYRDATALVNHQFRKGEGIILAQVKSQSKKEFIENFIKKITLGDAENIVLLNKNKRKYSTKRNNLMHSNLYLSEHRQWDRKRRHEENKKSFLQSLDDLEYVLNRFTDLEVKLINNEIKFIKLR